MTGLSGKEIIIFLNVLNTYSDDLKDRIRKAVRDKKYEIFIGDVVSYTNNLIKLNRGAIQSANRILTNLVSICFQSCDVDSMVEFSDDMKYLYF